MLFWKEMKSGFYQHLRGGLQLIGNSCIEEISLNSNELRVEDLSSLSSCGILGKGRSLPCYKCAKC